jgi:O-antigen/teichoic acid export membrane protein
VAASARFERPEGIARNTAFSFGVQLATSVFTAALTLYLVRALGPHGYGLFALALAVGGLVSIPADLGITGSAGRFVAESRADRAQAARVAADSLVLKALASGATSVGLFAAAGWVAAGYGEPELEWPLRGVSLAVFGHSVMTLVRGIFVALGRISVNFRLVLAESAVESLASFTLVLLGAGATGAAFGRAVGYVFGAALGVVLVALALGRRTLAFREFRWSAARKIAGYAGVLALVDGAWFAFGQVDALVIGGFLGAEAVGVYAAPMRLVVFLQYAGLAVANAVAPRLARSGEEQPAVTTFVTAIRYLIVSQALVIPPLVVWAAPVTHLLFGEGYEGAVDVVRALSVFVFLSAVAPLMSIAANYLGEARRRIPIVFATLALDLALAVMLVPTVGIVGAAIATSAAFTLYTAGHLWICRRLLRLPLRPIFTTLARAAAAAAALAGVLAAVGTSDLSLADWIVGGVGGTAVFIAVLVATRELGRGELVAIRTLIRRAHA